MRTPMLTTPLLLLAAATTAQEAVRPAAEKPHAVIARPNAVAWRPAPASLPAGARLAVLEGDPAQPGPFTMRLWMPAGYEIRPHYHPAIEHVTVLRGTFHVGMGERFDRNAAAALPAGTFAFLQPGVRHYAFTDAETVIQLHGVGPWKLIYVNPADDPSTRKVP